MRGYCDLVGLHDPQEREALLELAEHSAEPGWWYSYRDLFGENDYVGFEDGASQIAIWEPLLIPGLAQTASYAEHVTRATRITDPDEVKRRVEVRVRRQRILDLHAEPPTIHMLIGEAAIAARVGTPTERAEQIEHLVALAARPMITVQIVPFDAGAHPAMATGPFTVLDYSDSRDRPILYMETELDARYLEQPDELDRYRDLLTRLESTAHTAADSLKMLRTFAHH